MDEGQNINYMRARKHGLMSVLVLSMNYVTQVLIEISDFTGQLTELAAQHRQHQIDEEHFEEVIGGFDGNSGEWTGPVQSED